MLVAGKQLPTHCVTSQKNNDLDCCWGDSFPFFASVRANMLKVGASEERQVSVDCVACVAYSCYYEGRKRHVGQSDIASSFRY